MKKYFPILFSKKGETVALQHLKQDIKDSICPVIDVLKETLEKKVLEKKVVTSVIYNEEFETNLKTHWSFFGNQIILDFWLFKNIDEKVPEIKKMLVRLIKKGVNVVPAIHIHSSSKYVEMVKLIVVEYRLNVCIRTSDIDGGVDRFKMNAEKIFEILAIDTSRIILLLDLGYVKMEIINSLSAATKNAIKSLKTPVSNWLNIVVAAGSFPEDLTYVKNPNPNKLPRHEWEIWKHIHKDPDLLLVNYGDFGTKYPMLKDVALFAPTVSLKYTTEEYFIIYKGLKSEDHPNGHGQYITHASNIVKSRDYSGKTFSWGDLKIYEISNENIANNKRKTGSSTTWVQISQNHHISLINSLL